MNAESIRAMKTTLFSERSHPNKLLDEASNTSETALVMLTINTTLEFVASELERAHEDDYHSYEVVPVTVHDSGDVEAIYDPERDDRIAFWTLYGRRTDRVSGLRLADALLDFDSPNERDDAIRGIEAVTGETVTRYSC